MIFSNICPVCKKHELGSQSTSRRSKKTFKTCGSKECSYSMRGANHKPGATFSQQTEEYHGDERCDCGNYARYRFKTGKLCCQRSSSNCPIVRVEINNKIAQRLRDEIDDQGLSGIQRKALKAAQTKRDDIDQFGKNGFDRFSEKLRETIEHSRDDDGRTYQSRSKMSYEEFLLKPERDKYYAAVWSMTEQQYREHFTDIKDAKLRGNDYHLDHIYSVAEGFRKNIPVEVIANYTNLRVISATLNCSKQDECHKTLTQLYEDFESALARTSSNV